MPGSLLVGVGWRGDAGGGGGPRGCPAPPLTRRPGAAGAFRDAGGARRLLDHARAGARIVAVFPRLAERWNTPADYLSGGEQQMVAVARALAGNVQVLLLDEPFEGLSPAVTQELFEVFDRLRQEIAMVIVDHHLDLALALSDRTVVLERGSVIWSGVSTLLKDDLDLRRKVLWL